MQTLELCHADTCLPDYWSGHHRAHLQTPAYKGMTLAQLKAALRSELNQGAIAGSEDLAQLLSHWCDLPEGMTESDKETAYAAALAAIDALEQTEPGAPLFTDQDDEDEDSETVYAFFVFMPLD